MGRDLIAFGYAPGAYVSKCCDCGAETIADKRAWRCEPCAIIAADKPRPPAPQTLYCVSMVTRSVGVEVFGQEHDISLSWAKGMVGAIPVFDNEEDALSEAGDKYQVMLVTTLAATAKQEVSEDVKGGKVKGVVRGKAGKSA